jgi:AcrR family transcriptional regulator
VKRQDVADAAEAGAGRAGGSGRRERDRLATRARLLGAAREIAAEEGWQAVTIRRIADRLEYASPILYQHFSGKDALLLELVGLGFRELSEALEPVGAAPADEVLTALATRYWDFAFATRELYMVMHGLDGVPFGTSTAPKEAHVTFTVVRAVLLRLAEAGGRTLADPDGAVDVLWAYLHGFVSLTMSGRIAGGPERARALLLRGLPSLFDSLTR